MSVPRHYRPTPSAQIWADEAVTEPIPVVNVLGVGMDFSSESEAANNLRAEMAVFNRRPWRHDGTGRHRAVTAAPTIGRTSGRHRSATPTAGASVGRVAVWVAALGVLGFGGYSFTAEQVLSPSDYPAASAVPPPVPVQVTTDPPIAGHGGGHSAPDPVPFTTTRPTGLGADDDRGGPVDCGH